MARVNALWGLEGEDQYQYENHSLGARLVKRLGGKDRWTNLRGAVAYAKMSGVGHLVGPLRTFLHDNPEATVSLSVGIGMRVSSYEGVETLRNELPDGRGLLFICHNTMDGGLHAFHPKCWELSSNGAAYDRVILVGSGNLTNGGLYTNYELGVEVVASLTEDEPFIKQVSAFLDRRLDESRLDVRRATPEILQELLESGDLPREERHSSKSRSHAGKSDSECVRQLFGEVPCPSGPPSSALECSSMDGNAGTGTKESSDLLESTAKSRKSSEECARDFVAFVRKNGHTPQRTSKDPEERRLRSVRATWLKSANYYAFPPGSRPARVGHRMSETTWRKTEKILNRELGEDAWQADRGRHRAQAGQRTLEQWAIDTLQWREEHDGQWPRQTSGVERTLARRHATIRQRSRDGKLTKEELEMLNSRLPGWDEGQK